MFAGEEPSFSTTSLPLYHSLGFSTTTTPAAISLDPSLIIKHCPSRLPDPAAAGPAAAFKIRTRVPARMQTLCQQRASSPSPGQNKKSSSSSIYLAPDRQCDIIRLSRMARPIERHQKMFTVGEYEIDETKIAPAVTLRFVKSGVAHVLSNECAANVLGKTKRAIVGKDGKPDTVTDAMLATWREDAANQAQIVAWEDAYRAEKIAAIYDGTLSVRVARGPSRDPEEAAARAIAKSEIMGIFKTNGLKFPGKDETAAIANPVTGVVIEHDADGWIDLRLGNPEHGPRIAALAKRKVADDKRLRDATAKAVGAEAGGLAASLGL